MADVETHTPASEDNLTDCGRSETVNGHSVTTFKTKNNSNNKDELENGDIDECENSQVNGEIVSKNDTIKNDVNCDTKVNSDCNENGDSDLSVEEKEVDDKSGDKNSEIKDSSSDNDEDCDKESSDNENGIKEVESDKEGSEEESKDEDETKDKEEAKDRSDSEDNEKSSVKENVNKKDGSDDEIEITNEISNEATTLVEDEDDDDDDDDDIEMIEESDPLAISDADVKKAKEEQKNKKDSNVVVIDTNTLIKNQMNLTASVASSTRSHSVKPNVPIAPAPQSTSSTNTAITSATIQTAMQGLPSGTPAIQGLQTAYLSAIQQVILAQGSSGGSPGSNPQYVNQLQQYYNTLGALQDDAYVIEAPSFIVPYVMEGKPKDTIKEFLERMNKEHEEKLEEEKKKKEKKDDKETDEKDDKETDEKDDKETDEKNDKETDEKDDECKEEDSDKSKIDDKESKKDDEKMESDDKESKAESELDEKETSQEEKMETDETESKEEEKSEIDEKESEDNKKSVTDETKSKDEKMEIDGDKSKEGADDDKKLETDEKDTKDNKEKVEDKVEEKKEEKDDEIAIEKEVKKEDFSHLGRWESYYHSALGKFFLELGLNQAQEFIQSDLLRMQKRRLEKLKTKPSRQDIIAAKSLEQQLVQTKIRNSHLHVPLKTCKFCSFKTESKLVMNRHLESPHMINYTYKCNFCEFETRGPQIILFHMEAEHNTRGRLERAPAFFQCPLCPYEDNNKSKMTRHSMSCLKKFKAEKNLDLSDWEPPAKIPKLIRGRPNTLGKTFEPLKMQSILPKTLGGLGGINLNIQNALSSGLLTAVGSNASSLAARGRGRPVGSYKNLSPSIPGRNNQGSVLFPGRGGAGFLQNITGVTTPQQLTFANQMLQSVQNKSGNSKSPQQPSISITPLPRGGVQLPGVKAGSPNALRDANARPSFVICEVCDGYIKDLEQLRNHMNLIHKVKIHPKMIYNRPPLNCQKCQQRFFTDQGLERHLLGTHGLVTSSMQEAANKGKDAGRCPICGKVFQWKLLNHVSRDHKMTLKPAHLSYKCTVCTATFNMYRLFENHVYSAHSVVNKNKDASGGSSSNSASTSSTSSAKKTTGTETPLKINDEITIIPQPAAKTTKSTEETKSPPKKSDTPTVSKEITITKVGSRSTRRSAAAAAAAAGEGVEVISLDEGASSGKRSAEDAPKRRNAKRTKTSS